MKACDRFRPDKNVSPLFKPNRKDAQILSILLRFEKMPHAVVMLDRVKHELSPYAYWFALGTFWVSYSGWSDLDLWKRLFALNRMKMDKRRCLMKPAEWERFVAMSSKILAFRCHRKGEQDWIAYTISRAVVERLHWQRGPEIRIAAYEIQKQDVIAFFDRRGEEEVIVLDKSKAREIPLPEWRSL